MAAAPRLNRVPAGRLCAAFLLAAGWSAGGASAAGAQEPQPRDTLVETLPDSVREAFAEAEQRDPQAFPERRGFLRGPATEVFLCGRECVRGSTALSLLDLLLAEVPGIHALRGDLLSGPHHAFAGPYGPGFVRLFVDGREMPALERAQVDLRRVSLVYVDEVRVYRDAAGLVIEVDTYHHLAERAYSRISGGTGSPSLQILDGIFANGLGRSFLVNGSFDLLDFGPRGVENDRFEALGRATWAPGRDFGVAIDFRRETIDRQAADTVDAKRNELLVRARGNIGSRAQLEVFGAMSSFEENVSDLEEGEEPPRRDVDAAGLRLAAGIGPASLDVGARVSAGGAWPERAGRAAAAIPLGPASIEAGYERESWSGFSTSSWRVAAALADTLVLPIRLGAFAAAGDRGVGFPALDSATHVGFDGLGAWGGIRVGPFDVSGRYAREKLDRHIPLAATFDALAVVDSGRVEVTSWEVRAEGPLIPIGLVIPGLAPIRLRGFWRQNDIGAARPLYLPDHVARAELTLHDRFFDDHLELRVSGFLERRGPRLAPEAGEAEPLLVSGDTWSGGELTFKIADFRFFYRFANPAGQDIADVVGATLPRNLGVFGIRWEFYN